MFREWEVGLFLFFRRALYLESERYLRYEKGTGVKYRTTGTTRDVTTSRGKTFFIPCYVLAGGEPRLPGLKRDGEILSKKGCGGTATASP